MKARTRRPVRATLRPAAAALPRAPATEDRRSGHSNHSLAEIDVAPPHDGERLPDADRTRFSARLGALVPDIRLHRGVAGAKLTANLGVPAFTVGRDVVLGPGFQLGSSAGDATLAHELAHAIQQSGAAATLDHAAHRTRSGDRVEAEARDAAAGLGPPRTDRPLAIAAADPAPVTLPPMRTFKQLWPEFVRAQFAMDVPKATALAKQLAAAPYDFPDLLEHGIELVTWLDQHGEPAAAKELLEEVRRVWLIEFISRDSKLPSMQGLQWNTSDPGRLITLGQDAARAGRHDIAFQYLGVANEILSYYAMQLTERRATNLSLEPSESGAGGSTDPEVQKAILEAQVLPRMIGRSMQYSSLKQVYDEMRRIYSVYPGLEREAIGANDQKAAAAARAKAAELKAEIKRQYTWGSAPTPGSTSQEIREPVEVAEVSYDETPRGPGLTLHGANNAETTLTQLPGLPSPKEIGNDVQVQNLASLQEALMAQANFHAEIGRVPEIRAEFGSKVIDMNDTATRQKVWLIMFKSFATAGPSPLGALMGLVGRYLKAYTIHTQYNVRDWGVSYLDSTMPTDLAGRAERDCGVYALTVAWDIYQTAKRGDASLDLAFDLVTMLEHVTLIITDRTAGEFFMVNNDVVTGPHKGTPDRELSAAYGGVRQLPYTVGPSVPVQIGTTKDAPRPFHDQAWTRYTAAVDWGLAPRTGQTQKDRYERFYRDQQAFSENAEKMDRIVDAMNPIAGDVGKLGAEIDTRIDGATIMIGAFIALGPKAGVVAGSKATQQVLPSTANFLYTMPPGRAQHPLARFAMAILRLHKLGRVATTKETDYLAAVDRIVDFKAAVDGYRQAGSTGSF